MIASKYRIERLLGEGGMGTVVAATHLMLGTQVALKLLHHDMALQQSVVDRFLREARASAALRGDHVCRVSDVGVDERGIPYLVMELLEGRDLNSIVKQDGPIAPAVACDYVLQACLGIAEAHAAGIVHRDIKPGNLFLARRLDGSSIVKVLDFGVAKAPEGGDFSLTRTSTVMGSPGYMSPEQLKSSKDVDPRSDIWSLGVVMYELVTGRQPFQGESITELALRVAMDPTPVLTNVPRSFAQIVERCLEKDPARRFQDTAQLAAALAPLAGPGAPERAAAVARVLYGVSSVPRIAVVAAPSAPTTLRSATGSVVTTPPRARSWRLPAIIGGGIAAGVIAVVVATSGKGSDGGTHVEAPVPASGDRLPASGSETAPAPAPAPALAPAPSPPPAPSPAPVTETVATPTPTPAAGSGSAIVAKPKPEVKKPKPKPRPEDVGDSRF